MPDKPDNRKPIPPAPAVPAGVPGELVLATLHAPHFTIPRRASYAADFLNGIIGGKLKPIPDGAHDFAAVRKHLELQGATVTVYPECKKCGRPVDDSSCAHCEREKEKEGGKP